MTISEMHHLFRTIGQAKGLQLVRAVLPESVDDYLNSAIMEKCRSVIIQNTSTAFPDKITVRDNPTTPYNALRTLFKTKTIVAIKANDGNYFTIVDADSKTDVLSYLSVSTKYDDNQYPCRLIEPDKLSHVLNDFCNAPSKEYPCCTIENEASKDVKFKVYTNDDETPSIVISLIEMPAKVNISESVDCNLPDYIHNEIVEIAVNKYFNSVGSTSKQVN